MSDLLEGDDAGATAHRVLFDHIEGRNERAARRPASRADGQQVRIGSWFRNGAHILTCVTSTGAQSNPLTVTLLPWSCVPPMWM